MHAAKLLYFAYASLIINTCHGGFADYLNIIGSYMGYKKESSVALEEGFEQKVPYEVSIADEKFISNAIELSGAVATELDSCQHRVVLKLHSDCQNMNDETISKMAVALLNCQSYVEGRKIYPCNDAMSIKDCTSQMDADAWNSYHLMTNRARAVCYSVRQVQFRGLTEHTINRLMDAARHQMSVLGKLNEDQENLHHIAKDTLKTVAEGQEELAEQQQDLKRAQLYGQLAIEDNIKRLSDEKQMIIDSQVQLAEMTQDVQRRLTEASAHIETQITETDTNHKELLEDLIRIQEKTQTIFDRIDETSRLLYKQSEMAREQYEMTLNQLSEVNKTVHSLVNLVGGTKQAMEERLAWITESLGGTDDAVERMCLILWHFAFLITAMIACAFLGARMSTRMAVITLVPVNLALSLYDIEFAADALTLSVTLAVYIAVQALVIFAYSVTTMERITSSIVQEAKTPHSNASTSTAINPVTPKKANDQHSLPSTPRNRAIPEDYTYDEGEDFSSPTPPLSRSGFYSSRSRSRTPLIFNGSFRQCTALTLKGLVCKNNAAPGRDYCQRHQNGSSVLQT